MTDSNSLSRATSTMTFVEYGDSLARSIAHELGSPESVFGGGVGFPASRESSLDGAGDTRSQLRCGMVLGTCVSMRGARLASGTMMCLERAPMHRACT